MTTYIITILLTAIIMVAVGYAISERASRNNAVNYQQQLAAQKADYERRLLDAKAEGEAALRNEREAQQRHHAELSDSYEKQLASMRQAYETQITQLKDTQELQLQQSRDNMEKQLQQNKDSMEKQREAQQRHQTELSDSYEKQLASMRQAYETQIAQLKDTQEQQLQQSRDNMERQLQQSRDNMEKQLQQNKNSMEKQLEALKLMNKQQVESQLSLIRQQMQTTSEEVLKRRQDELGERNREQVSKIIDPLQQSLKEMQEAFNLSKSQQSEALTRLDETIKINMQKSAELGETADRLTRALTGEVKVQGNFGELKLKQLLEDMDLKEGEQFDTQETLRDKAGRSAKGDDGKGLIPDFILHFPNNRHVVVDSKMSLTDYERYMNAEDGSEEKTAYLKAHIASVRAQVKRLARKEYTKYLPSGYNRLNFAIMYVPIEGALNLALLNDGTLWREAYDEGVLILGPQTMYMNLRVLEMMWTQVRQLKNQQAMMDAANSVVERVQDFGMRFMDVEASMGDTVKKMAKLKITTADSGPSIITAAKKLLAAGAKENKKKKSLDEMDNSMFIEGDKEGN